VAALNDHFSSSQDTVSLDADIRLPGRPSSASTGFRQREHSQGESLIEWNTDRPTSRGSEATSRGEATPGSHSERLTNRNRFGDSEDVTVVQDLGTASTRGRTTLSSDVSPISREDHHNGHRHAIRAMTAHKIQITGGSFLGRFRRSRNEPCFKAFSRTIVENKYFVAFTTILTVYALIGDDIRLLATNQPADDWFNGFTLTCLGVFTFEIVLSCVGKNDYFLGFFFCLDVISTATLLLDLTWVSELVFGNGEGKQLRSGRTARLGAKAGRVVRVIRLVRIIKLWKAIQDAKIERQRKEREKNIGLGEDDPDDWGEDEDSTKKARLASEQRQESRVGKKLSEITTRKVIILVLTMLLVLPFLQTDETSFPPQSPWLAADTVYELFMEWNTTGTEETHLRYERAMLKYLYYHNWFTGNIQSWVPESALSPRSFQSHVFWAGIDFDSREEYLAHSHWIDAARIRPSTVASYQQEVLNSEAMNIYYLFGIMPDPVVSTISSAWTYDCDYSDGYRAGFSVLEHEIDGLVGYAAKCPENLRLFERESYYPRVATEAEYNKWHFVFYFDTRPYSKSEAMYGLMLTGFICIVLCLASLYFSNDANRLVLRPVENMVNRVEIIRNDPLIAVQMADEEFRIEEKEKSKLQNQARHHQAMQGFKEAINICGGTGQAEVMETVILEKTIIKLGSLLALGFGEAGANIIGHNLESSASAGVNAMIEGERVEAIIGLARIRDFSTATEVLKGKVMTFVNQIAEIVHGVVSQFHGAANKNNGDTFLLVWRISGVDGAMMVKRMADMSTIAFAKILAAIHRSPILATYRGHPALQQRLGGTCRVCLTFGLHAGWAIEGAVGSEFKIDASYLSPNVSIAVQVEQATSIYDVPILITEQVVQLSSEKIADKFRKIDQVIIKGSADSTCLYCLDLDYLCLKVDTDTSSRPATWNSRFRFKARQFLEAEKKRDFEVPTIVMFEKCTDIMHMSRRYTTEFGQIFNMGFQNYLQGEWQVAEKFLSRSQHMLHFEDGPSSALLEFMRDYSFQAPSSWRGVHDLLPPSVS